MAITNAIQGLNQTVELLSRILANIEASNQQSGKEATEVKTSDGKKATSLDGLGSTVKMFEKINPKKAKDGAQSAADILKTISDKNFIKNITTLVLSTPILKGLGVVINTIVDALNGINNLKIEKETVDKFNNTLKSVNGLIKTVIDVIDILPKMILGLSLIIVTSIMVSYLAIHAWDKILIGFGTIVGIGILTIALFAGLSAITKRITGTGAMQMIKNPITGIDNMITTQVIQDMVMIIAGLSGIVIVSALVGVLAIHAYGKIILGFGVIAGIGVAVMGLFWLLNKMSKLIFTNKGPGKQKFGLTVTDMRTMATNAASIGAIAGIVALLYALSGLVVIAALVGVLAIHATKYVFSGLGVIALMLVALGGIMLLLNLFTKSVDSKKLLYAAGLLVAISGVILILSVVGIMVTLLGKTIDAAGGLNTVWSGLALVGILLGGMLVITGLLAALCMIPGVKTALGVAIGVLLGMAITLSILVNVAFKVVELANILNKDKLFDNASITHKFGFLGLALTTLFASILPAALLALAYTPMVIQICALLDAVGKFVDIIGKIAADDSGNMSIISVNEKGEAVKGGKVNVLKVANALSNSFSQFMSKMSETFANFDRKDKRKFMMGAKAAERVMDACGKLVDLIENANKRISSAKLESVASSISEAFSTFMTSLSTSFNKMETRSAIIIGFLSGSVAKIMSGIDGFTNGILALSKFDTNSINTTASNIASGMNKLFETLSTKNIPDYFKSKNIATVIKNINQEFVAALSEMSKPISQNATTQFDNFITKLTDANFETAKSNIDNIKVSLQNYNDIASKSVDIINNQITKFDVFTESVKDLVDALNDLEKTNANLNLNLNSNTNSSPENNKPTKVKEQEKPIEVIVKNVGESLNIADFADAIKDAFNGNTIKITFNDSRDDIIGQVSML